jgi:hypothetical protein
MKWILKRPEILCAITGGLLFFNCFPAYFIGGIWSNFMFIILALFFLSLAYLCITKSNF